MRTWIYGYGLDQIQQMRDKALCPHDTVAGFSVCAADDRPFPQSGLTPALYAAMRSEIDQLIVADDNLLGSGPQRVQIVELFQSYGVSIKSASNCGINSS